ncbi:hypothetical protein GCM10027294_26580 [Marinactinospora endophytica]
MGGEGTGTHLSFAVLGPLEVHDGNGPLALKGPRHREVLARLIAAEGRVVPLDQLIDDLWDVPPPGATAAIRTFVSALRRTLEPHRPPRRPARLLVTAPPGYALRTTPHTVDAQRFETATADSGTLLEEADPARALSTLEEALALWRGPAYAEFADRPWARGIAERLEETRLVAVERRAEALLNLGRHNEAVPLLHTHTLAHPLREDAWRQLALALYRSGQQAQALTALRRARDILADELGVDPGPRLRRVHDDILAHAPHLAPPRPPAPPSHLLLGRDRELRCLEQAAATATRTTTPTTVLISGDPGTGKTALAEAFTHRMATRGWTTAWGRAPEHDGAPGTWPWTQIATTLTATAPTTPPPEPDPVTTRFHALRAATDLIAHTTRRGPLLLVFDDLHQAGEETLELFTTLAAHTPPGPLLLVGTHHPGTNRPPLTAALARLAPHEPDRIHLRGLTRPATDDLVRAITGHDVTPHHLALIHRRSDGNPFFARELARLLRSRGADALDAIPAGVGDIIHHRLATLPRPARRLLDQAAVIGRDVDPAILAALADDEEELLDTLDTVLLAGFLTEEGATGLRFTHLLVRDAIYDAMSHARRTRRHAAVAAALETLRPGDNAALAHHYGRAGTPAAARRAAHHARLAALHAQRHFAPYEAARLWRAAATAHDRSATTDLRGRLEATMGMARALAVTGRLDEARRQRSHALTTAAQLGDPHLTAQVLTTFDVPAVWTRGDDPELAQRIADTARTTLDALPRNDAHQRARLLSTIALELRATPHGRRAALQAETIARGLDDPGLLALALNARFLQSFDRTGLAPQRAEIGTELLDLATRHDLVTFEILGHLILLQAHSARADLASADTHTTALDRLGDRHEIPLIGVFTQGYTALRLAIAGNRDEAASAYHATDALLATSGMPGMRHGLLSLALASLHLPGPAPTTTPHDSPYAPWLLALTTPQAPTPPPPPRGHLDEALTCLAAQAAITANDHAAMDRAYRRLLPAAPELAGAGSGLLTMGPVAHHLGDLAAAQGRPDDAAAHYRQARRVALTAGSALWADAARTATRALR